MKKIPISAAKGIGDLYNQDQVIIISYCSSTESTNVTTWGKHASDKTLAASAGNYYKKQLGFPDEMCNDKPQDYKEEYIVPNLTEIYVVAKDAHAKGTLNHHQFLVTKKSLMELQEMDLIIIDEGTFKN